MLLNNIWENSDYRVDPSNFTLSFTAIKGHELSIDSDFEADAYVSSIDYDSLGNPLEVVADYSHTLKYTITGVPGAADLIGSSGHDYAIASSPVSEPDGLALFAVGLAILNWRRRARGVIQATATARHDRARRPRAALR